MWSAAQDARALACFLAALAAACGDGDAGSAGGAPDAAAVDGGTDSATDAGAELDAAPTEWPAPKPATTLPIEVLGAPGTGVEVSIALDAADVDGARAAGSASLALTVHNIVRPDSAEVYVNDGPALDLGAVDGPFLRELDGQVASGAVAVPATSLVAGDNRIVFRYTRQIIDRAAVSGFRVLDVALDVAGRRIALQLPAEDPSQWQPLDPTAEAIERGRSFFQDVSRDGGPACARCHADSGADLQYYAFSTNSIAERAMFHEFTRAEADDIASYIRSLPVVTTGRPYDGPFQPGAANHGAAGAGYAAVLADDAAFAQSAFGGANLPATLPWDWASSVDTFRLPARAAAPSWMRWLPRQLNDDWFTRKDAILASAEQALAATPTLEAAQTFMSAALTVGKDVLLIDGDYAGKIDVLRFAAVKLWDWSRKNGFDRPDHGVPDGSPAYPYEVGFAFFEAARSQALAGAAEQTMDWWWVQLAANPGRGFSTGRRPLNFEDVLLAAEDAAIGPAHIAFLHLYGSWEESRGALTDVWGTVDGPVRLLLVPMRTLGADERTALMRRFLVQESEYVSQLGTLDTGHHQKLASAWTAGCSALSATQIAELRALAPEVVRPDLAACP